MTCEQIERDEISEQYLGGRLSADAEARFEEHYFDCTRCQERLRVLGDTRAALAREVALTVGQPAPKAASMARASRIVWRVAGAGLAVAAAILLAVRILQVPDADPRTASGQGPSRSTDVTLPGSPSTPPALDLRALAQFQPPRYEAPRLRANTAPAQRIFRDAMEQYVAADYAGAAAGLRRAIALDQSLVGANFYLAICVLQGEQTDEAVMLFQRVIAAGESPYLEDAHFFLAIARIRQGDIAAARSELTRVTALDGDRRNEARRLLAQLP